MNDSWEGILFAQNCLRESEHVYSVFCSFRSLSTIERKWEFKSSADREEGRLEG